MKRIPFNALVVLACLAGSDPRIFAQTSTPATQAPSASQPGETSQTGQPRQKPSSKPADAALTPDDPEEQIPVVRLEFKPAGVVPGVSGTSAFVNPVVCSADGVPYVSFMDAKSISIDSVTSLDPKGGHVFSTQQIQGLYGISSILGVSVTDSMVGLRITATKDPTKSPQTIGTGQGAPPMNGYSGKRRFFLAEFDLSGNFIKAVELPEELYIWRLAALPDDSLLALGYDLINARPHLMILDSGGERKRDLQIPAMMDENTVFSEASSGDWKKRNQALGALNSWQFAWARQKVLLFQAHSSAPILEVGAGGAVREVTIEHPKGYGIDSVLPSNDRWLIRFRKDGLSEMGAIDSDPKTKNYVLYEVDSTDGSLKRRIEMADGMFYSSSCEKDGTVTAFTIDQGKVNLFSADLGR
ncbi:hypothetical protein [Terracidiphilus gabretensis]|uniref:hypothetical protein n=1 Tax=Terracidiphilus gabretensis TaxID=1577687 RepID=UPI00071B4CD8|nr:hypothetical protein [Terracidiphilus gabretensis]